MKFGVKRGLFAHKNRLYLGLYTTYSRRVCTEQRVFGDGRSNGATQIASVPTLVATKFELFSSRICI